MADTEVLKATDKNSAGNNNDNKNTGKKQSFVKGLKKEFKKVTWPDGNETVKQTTAVIVVSLVLGLIIALMDTVIQYGVNWLTTF